MLNLTLNGKQIYGLLIDMDGVLYIGTTPITGAVGVMNQLSRVSFPFRYVTNTTRMNRSELHSMIRKMGIPSTVKHIVSAPVATAAYLRSKKATGIFLIAEKSVSEDFSSISLDKGEIEYVVMGDPGENPDIALLNKGLNFLLEGAGFLAMQKNRYWRTEKGLVMDAGAYVAALEYASGKEAMVIGKPSADFFRLAAEQLELPYEHIAVIGDDIEMDIAGAKNVGLHTILVRTGKYREDSLINAPIKPDLIIGSISELTAHIS
jgi:HAD superfamily hydrolase (TIGR01458 family)